MILDLVALAERLDVTGFEADFRADGVGGVPYDPRLMLVTVLWCYAQQIRSPQAIARACREQVSLRMVWQRDRVPTASTVRRFIGGHRSGWQRVSISLLAVCGRDGLIDVSLTATDSTPVTAPAAMAKTLSAARITVAIDQAEQELARLRRHLDEAAADADLTGFIEAGCGPLIRAEQMLLVRLDRLRDAEARARAHTARRRDSDPHDSVRIWQDRVDKHTTELAAMTERQNRKVADHQAKVAAGRKPRGPAPRTAAHHPGIRRKQEALARARARLTTARAADPGPRAGPVPANLTDPTARILKGKNLTRWVMGRLLTLTVVTSQIILAGILSPAGNDYPGLLPNLAATADNCRDAGITGDFGHHLADSGFAGPETLTTPAPIDGTLLVCVTNEHDQNRGRTGTSHTAHRREMAARLATETGRDLYRRRSAMVEPVFAHLLRLDRRLHTRGDAQHSETLAIITAYNAFKYLRKPPKPVKRL
ncbi:MAG TPA: transposase [Actinoplanes sp.]|nr:transposase [Actinoplanes sp.]